MRVTRDRKAKRIYLDQQAYIETIAKRFGIDDSTRNYDTPRTPHDLLPRSSSEGEASSSERASYQEKVGCSGYVATMTRPDLAEGVSKLSQFLQNPSKKHQSEVFRLIAHCYQYRDHALMFRDLDHQVEDATAYTDASFGNLPDRRSFQGHIFFVLRSPVF
jgi:hypothetical protein